jgi:hypothetical protein
MERARFAGGFLAALAVPRLLATLFQIVAQAFHEVDHLGARRLVSGNLTVDLDLPT